MVKNNVLGSVVGFAHNQSLQPGWRNPPGARLIPSSFGHLPLVRVDTSKPKPTVKQSAEVWVKMVR